MTVLIDAAEELSDREYELFRTLIYDKCGINLGPQKQQLIRARLGKRLRAGNFRSYRDYYEFVRNDNSGAELTALIDAISTNTTHLFREQQHFDFLRTVLGNWLENRTWRSQNPELRCWSAGCSTGEEPYSIAMTLDEVLGNAKLPFRILATDISTRVLERAQQGEYEAHRLGTVPEAMRRRYFVNTGAREAGVLAVHPELKQHITFRHFNLMTPTFPFRRGFHIIFCRNVMIYFDRPTQEALVGRFAQHLLPGGHLLIGHSESLNSIKHNLKYVQPTIYQRP